MYLRFKSPFRGDEQPLITSQGSLKEPMDCEKGDGGFSSPRIGYITNFLKDVLKVPKSVSRWGMTSSTHFSRILKGKMDRGKGNKSLGSPWIICTKF